MDNDNNTTTTAITGGSEIESFVNLDLMDVEPEETISLTVTPKNDVVGADATLTTTQICATMKARKLPEEFHRTPVDILVVLDRSTSMAGDKLALCKETLELLLRHLLPSDRFGLISYGHDATIEVPMQKVTPENKESTLSKIKALQVYGCTNISGAVALAFQEIHSLASPNNVQSIFLLTDGHANEGISDKDGLVELTRNCWMGLPQPAHDQYEIRGSDPSGKPPPARGGFFNAIRRRNNGPSQQQEDDQKIPTNIDTARQGTTGEEEHKPISLFCFGYGNDHNAQMLQEMAAATVSGSYYHVKDDIDVGSSFGDAMGGILSVVAQGAVLTIGVPPSNSATTTTGAAKILKVHHERAIEREDGTFSVNIGDFYAEESKDVLVEVNLVKGAQDDGAPVPHIVAMLGYTDILDKKPAQTKAVSGMIRRPSGPEVSEDNVYVTSQWLRIVATDAMKVAQELAKNNDLAGARKRLADVKTQIASSPQAVQADAMIVQLKNDLMEAERNMASVRTYNTSGGDGFLNYKHQTYRTQRCAEPNTSNASVFRGSTKMQMSAQCTIPSRKQGPPKTG